MIFDLASTKENSHDFVRPELTNCSTSVDINFSATLANNFEVLFMGERTSTIKVSSDRKLAKITLITHPRNG